MTEPVAPLLRAPGLLRRRAADAEAGRGGTLLIGGGWPSEEDSATGTPGISLESLHANLRVAQHVVPALAQVRLLRVWTGVCNGTPDHRPILGELDGVSGFFVAAFPYLGFTAAPLMGRLVADLSRGLGSAVRPGALRRRPLRRRRVCV